LFNADLLLDCLLALLLIGLSFSMLSRLILPNAFLFTIGSSLGLMELDWDSLNGSSLFLLKDFFSSINGLVFLVVFPLSIDSSSHLLASCLGKTSIVVRLSSESRTLFVYSNLKNERKLSTILRPFF